MNTCDQCTYYSSDTAGFLQRHYCRHHTYATNGGDKFFFVSPSGTCPNFSPKATRSSSGYQSGGCFLTSACVEYLGKADDCEELTALRAFRDGYMKSTEEGNALVKQYYEVAPTIVERINASDKKEKYYQYVYEVIEKCVKLIDIREYERTLNEYKLMVLNLKKEFSL